QDFANSVLRDMIRIRIQAALSGIFTSGGSDMANAFASFFGGAHANGGIAPAGKISLVGEDGPELIMPQTASRVIPNSMLGGDVKVTVDNRGTPIQAVDTEVRFDAEAMIVKVITEDLHKGGSVSSAFSRTFGLRR
ncbi:MAG: hypothetical protein AABZ67_05895, partial [Pseudomonadota bacterium]